MKTLFIDFKNLQKLKNHQKVKQQNKENLKYNNYEIERLKNKAKSNLLKKNKKIKNRSISKFSLNQLKSTFSENKIKLDSSVINIGFNNRKQVIPQLKTEKVERKICFPMWKSSGTNKLNKPNLKIFATIEKNKKNKQKQIKLNENVFKNVGKQSIKNKTNKTLYSLLQTKDINKNYQRIPAKTKVLNFFFKNQIKKNNYELKKKKIKQVPKLSLKSISVKKSYPRKKKSRDSMVEEEFNIFGNLHASSNFSIHTNKNVQRNMTPVLFDKNKIKSNSIKKRFTSVKKFKYPNSPRHKLNFFNSSRHNKEIDLIKQRIDRFVKTRFRENNNKQFVKRKHKRNIKFKHKSQNTKFIKKDVNKLKLCTSKSISSLKVEVPLKSSFVRRKTIMEVNSTPSKNISKDIMNESINPTEINYNKFKRFNQKNKKKVNFQILNKTKLSQIKSPRKKKTMEESFEKTSFQYNEFDPKIINNSQNMGDSEFSQRMSLPYNFGNHLNRKHLMIKTNEYLNNWDTIPKTIIPFKPTKNCMLEFLQFKKEKKIIELRNQYKKLYKNHIKEVKKHADSIIQKCQLN
jgi:hypothetical protein